MISLCCRHPRAETARFIRDGQAADGRTAAGTRADFRTWLRGHLDLTETRVCDVVLAVSEALANVAEFAYLTFEADGTVDLEAVHNSRRSTLTVTIADRGRWRRPDPGHSQLSRGRGIPLMRILADGVSIDGSLRGTTVCLRFDGVHPGGPRARV